MQVQEKHRYHGIALAQVIEYKRFTALNPAVDHEFGHYQVNHDRELYVKYRSQCQGPPEKPQETKTYRFTVTPEETSRYAISFAAQSQTFLVLVCGDDTVLVLKQTEMKRLLVIPGREQQWIEVILESGISPRVRGRNLSGKPIVVAHNSCPKHVFES